MKERVDMTPFALETWVAVLGQYPVEVVNRAVVQIGLSSDPFPDLGKIVLACETIRRANAGTTPLDGVKAISQKMIDAVAAALELDIKAKP